MKSLITKCDFFAHTVSLTLNEKGDISYKTFMGGLISILLIGSSTICILYFMFSILNRDDIYIIHSTFINPNINLTYSHKLPFLLRLTDTNSEPYNEDEKLYYITASIWYGGTNDSNLSYSAKQYSVSLNVSKCDINKHFTNEYKNYFKNIIDLNTYYCLEPRNSSQTIYGIYGNRYPFSYYSLTLRYCKNSTENNNSCYSVEKIENTLDYTFLDVLFIDYTINSFKKNNENELFIRKERYELSSILFKRIWLYFENIKYIVDYGYIFSNIKSENFHRLESVGTDFNIFQKDFFCTLTILNSLKLSIYNKECKKIQDYLAIIGGLIKILTLFSSLLNYYNSRNSYYLNLIKDFIIENKELNNSVKNHKRNTSYYISNFNNDKILNFQNSNDNLIKKQSLQLNLLKRNDKNYKKINSSLSIKILPSFFYKKKHHEILSFYKEFINNKLNVFNVLKKLETINLSNPTLKKSISDKIQSDFLVNSNKFRIKFIHKN